jgi:hypothetical protein
MLRAGAEGDLPLLGRQNLRLEEIMRALLLKSAALAGLSLLAYSVQANPLLPVQNLTFSTYSGATPKDYFSTVNPAGWYRGTPGPFGDLVFIDAPNTATVFGGGPDSYPVYGPFPNPPPGGNFVQADGNPDYESSFNQDLTGLIVNQLYDLTFWQAAGQQQGFTGGTTEQWIVALGATGSVLNDSLATNPATYFDTDASAQVLTTPLMNTPSGGVSPWEEVTLSFTATAADMTLSFLAWGDNGNTSNLPPTVFLAGVNTPALPEPATLSLMGIGLLGFGASRMRRRAKHNAAV